MNKDIRQGLPTRRGWRRERGEEVTEGSGREKGEENTENAEGERKRGAESLVPTEHPL